MKEWFSTANVPSTGGVNHASADLHDGAAAPADPPVFAAASEPSGENASGLEVLVIMSEDEGLNEEAGSKLDSFFEAIKHHVKIGYVWVPVQARVSGLFGLTERLPGTRKVAQVPHSASSDPEEGVQYVIVLGEDDALNEEALANLEGALSRP